MKESSRLEFYYNYVHNIASDGIYPSQSLSGNMDTAAIIRYNLFAYCCYLAAAHFDGVQVYGGGAGPIVQFNTMYQPTADQNRESLGNVNSFYRIGDLGTSSPLTVSNPECGWNVCCGNGVYLSQMQWTTPATPEGFIANGSMHDNFCDLANIVNRWCYAQDANTTNIVIDNNMCLNNGSLLPSLVGAGANSWVPSLLEGNNLPTYRAPYTTNPDVESQSATLHTTSLSAGQTLVMMTASPSATSWATIADQANNFAIDGTGKITLTSIGATALQGYTGKLVITVKAANGSGVGNFGYGTVDLTCSP
jgi:hypothetical protein